MEAEHSLTECSWIPVGRMVELDCDGRYWANGGKEFIRRADREEYSQEHIQPQQPSETCQKTVWIYMFSLNLSRSSHVDWDKNLMAKRISGLTASITT